MQTRGNLARLVSLTDDELLEIFSGVYIEELKQLFAVKYVHQHHDHSDNNATNSYQVNTYNI